jgi:hypothetical protein
VDERCSFQFSLGRRSAGWISFCLASKVLRRACDTGKEAGSLGLVGALAPARLPRYCTPYSVPILPTYLHVRFS